MYDFLFSIIFGRFVVKRCPGSVAIMFGIVLLPTLLGQALISLTIIPIRGHFWCGNWSQNNKHEKYWPKHKYVYRCSCNPSIHLPKNLLNTSFN